GRHFDDDGGAGRPVTLVRYLHDLGAIAAARRALDRAIDVVGRHVVLFGLLDRQPEPKVPRRVGSARLRRDDDLFRELREDLPALGVVHALLALDRGPFRVTGHAAIWLL